MGYKKILKYGIRFLFLQITLTFTTIIYFDNFLIKNFPDAEKILIDNLFEDRERFYSFIPPFFIKIDIFLAIFIFLFLIILYSTKFYTYVDELTFKFDKKYLDDYFNLYLLFTSSLMTFFTLIRFTILSRANLIIFTFLVPLLLLIFRNSEVLSGLFGRATRAENALLINISKDSTFRNLKIINFRKIIDEINIQDIRNSEKIISAIDSNNKKSEINLIVLNILNENELPQKLEEYLININKKVLLISNNQIEFRKYFISRSEKLQGSFLTYFNNDIQYGSKYILKRIIDIFIASILLLTTLPLMILLCVYIFYLDGFPLIVKQHRVGLHGKQFTMYKFRTMKKDSHEKRKELSKLNKHSGPLFKIENDPRLLNGSVFIRNYSLDELPQLFNVLKGNMSIVGPRPLFREDTEFFDENYMRRLNVLPGITGLLQINERNTPDFSTWYKYDIEYIDNWSLYKDLKIILLTPFALFKKKTKGF